MVERHGTIANCRWTSATGSGQYLRGEKCCAASDRGFLLSPHPVELTNLPAVSDVENMLNVVQSHGAQVSRAPHSTTIAATELVEGETPYDTVRRMRATVLVLAPLLARLGKVRVSLPGGCAIGARPVDMHLKALSTLGADVSIDRGWIVASTDSGLIGSRIVLPAPSVGATATAMMAATSARGETEILNAAREPEIADLAACLGAMGAQTEGAGTHRILIQGDTSWRPARHHGIPDRIEAGTYAVAAAITGGTLELTHARLEHLASVVQMLETMGVSVWPSDRGLVISRNGALRGADLTTEPYPGFPTDLQAQFMALAACAEGASLIRETVFESRFMHVPELMRLGADIKLQEQLLWYVAGARCMAHKSWQRICGRPCRLFSQHWLPREKLLLIASIIWIAGMNSLTAN